MANMSIRTNVINKTVVRVELTWEQLQDLLLEAVKKMPGVNINGGTNIEIKLKQEEQGSPGYKLDRWNVQMKLETDNDWVPPIADGGETTI